MTCRQQFEMKLSNSNARVFLGKDEKARESTHKLLREDELLELLELFVPNKNVPMKAYESCVVLLRTKPLHVTCLAGGVSAVCSSLIG